MRRTPLMLALVTLLSSAPLTTSVALAEPPGTPERAGAAPSAPTPSATDDGNIATSVHRTAPQPVRGIESTTPATPVPMNLPDDANASEVENQYGVGLAVLIIGTVLIAALVVGLFLFISRRSWSTSH